MKEILFINAERTGYAPEQVRETMTVGELAEVFTNLAEHHGEDMEVYLRHDGGYTYGGITAWEMNVEDYEGDDD